MRHGRLPLNGLAHFSGLVVRLLKHGLIVLIQQNLAFHYNDPKDDTTYYEADWRNAYALVRSGKAIELVEQKFGDKAGGLVLNLQLFGHTRVQDFADAYGLSLQKKNHVVSDELHINGDGLPNGTGGNEHRVGKPQSKIESIEQFHAILHELSQAEYLIPVNEHSFQPPADFQAEAEFTISVSKGAGGPKGKAAKADYARDVTALKRKWRDGEDDASVVSTKKRKLNGSLANGINGVNGDHSYYPEMFTRLDVCLPFTEQRSLGC